jgi:hypothetical protein
MRRLTDHRTNDCNREIEIIADERDEASGASHEYTMAFRKGMSVERQTVTLQKGPIKEVGVNGVTNEALAAILIDRLRGFQSGPFSCRENALALTKFEEGLHWLEARTRERERRGVEGTNEK